jgi:hypothetical protein
MMAINAYNNSYVLYYYIRNTSQVNTSVLVFAKNERTFTWHIHGTDRGDILRARGREHYYPLLLLPRGQ